MARHSSIQARLLVVAFFGALGVLIGCTQIFGFQSPVAFCHLSSDCPPDQICSFGGCTPQCKTYQDCQHGEICSEDGMCRQPSDASVPDAPVVEASTPEAHASEAGPAEGSSEDATPTCGPVATDPKNCGRCGVECPSEICEDSECRNIVYYGAYAIHASSTAPPHQVGPIFGDGGQGVLAGVQVNIDHPGWVTQFGMLTAYGGSQAYVGLYSDAGGQPSTLLASTEEFTVNGDPSASTNPQSTVERVTPVHIDAGYYWILGMWQGDIAFETQGGTSSCAVGCVAWYTANETFGPLTSPLASKQTLALAPLPILYVGIAE